MNPSKIYSLKLLANFLRCEEEFIRSFLSGNIHIRDPKISMTEPQIKYETTINKLYIPKRNKKLGYRMVFAVQTETFKSLLKVLNSELTKIYQPDEIVQGFVSKRNIKTNAQCHLAKRNLLSVDIKDYFETITDSMVAQGLRKIGFSDFSSEKLSKLVTLGGQLPPGFNTSPTIANIVTIEMDRQLKDLAGNLVTYTRYADDLYLSSNETLPALPDIKNIISENGFALNDSKTKYMYRGSKQFVTGLTVFDDKRPRIPKRIKRRLRLELHYIVKFGYLDHVINKLSYTKQQYINIPEIRSKVNEEVIRCHNKISGWISFIGAVEKDVSSKLLYQFKQAENKKEN
jgi:RNA-directed DNA polymerase